MSTEENKALVRRFYDEVTPFTTGLPKMTRLSLVGPFREHTKASMPVLRLQASR